MTGKIDDKDLLADIKKMLQGAGDKSINSITGIFIDETLSEFYQLNSEIIIPHLPVKEIDLKNSHELAGLLIPRIPEYFTLHTFLEKRKPSSEQHSLHFIRHVEGTVVDFVHIIRFDFRFSGRRGRIIDKGDSEKYPSYAADMLYFKSHLVPVYKGSDPDELVSVRLKESIEIESDKRLFTSVIFDEYSSREISIELSRRAGADIFSVPLKIYPFINYEYFTACLNIPDPSPERIAASVQIFEPLFIYIYFNYRTSNDIIDIESVNRFADSIEIVDDKVSLKPQFLLDLKDYFSSYTLSTDDELLLKGWKRFKVN
ncbi:MAG TPA: hypothetical protein P5120_13570 [Spirochaetota bacterium]|nr:hypothetical protein [Spirochaetota bacterium]HPF07179.1 hypothetical protein [Spirochaetota bacterium]HPJ41614.1 hypothetical protein [Spirochaetota bacterium]HPR36715.1 hypothetical protein [Spirochaetota bacterium]HRX48542.1 hypothetical protein [Spirochaetota bacterium]